MIMSPVMGMLAFLMSEFTGIAYIRIAGYALIPALLYFMGIYFVVHLTSKKLQLSGTESKDRMPIGELLLSRGHLIIPIVVLIALLMMKYSPRFAVLYSILAIPFTTSFRKSTRMTIKQFVEGLENGAKNALLVVIAVALAGLLGGLIGMTGVGLKLSEAVLSVSGGYLLVSLVLILITTIVLGAGMPSVVAYTIQIPIIIPALNTLGVEPLVAHFLLVYFASMAFITPPVGMSFYAAAGIANADIMKSGLQAVKVGAVGLVVPFVFVYQPALLGLGSFADVSLAFISASAGVYALSVFSVGMARDAVGVLGRGIALASAVLLLVPGWMSDVLGVMLLVTVLYANQALGALRKNRSSTSIR